MKTFVALITMCAMAIAADDEPFGVTIDLPPAGAAIAGTLTTIGIRTTGPEVRECYWEVSPQLDLHFDDEEKKTAATFAHPEPRTYVIEITVVAKDKPAKGPGIARARAVLVTVPYVSVVRNSGEMTAEPAVRTNKSAPPEEDPDARPVDPRRLVRWWARKLKPKISTWATDVAHIATAMRQVAAGLEQGRVGGAPIAESRALASANVANISAWDGFFGDNGMQGLFARFAQKGAFGPMGNNAGNVAATLRVFADELDAERQTKEPVK